ncbi:hypothetical protein ACLOJK_039576 [Asimina triloba]
MASLLSFSSSPLPRTLPKPYKTSVPDKSFSPPKAPHLKKSKSSQIPSSLSENRAFPIPAAEIPPNFASGTAFLSSVLVVLVWILESRCTQRLLLPHRTINRRRHDLRRGNVVVGSWKLRLDVLPSIPDAYDRPEAIIDPAFLGISKAAERMAFRSPESEGRSELDENAAGLGIAKSENHVASGFPGIVKSADPVEAEIQKSYRHAEVVIDRPAGGIVKSSDFSTFGIWKSYEHPEVDIGSALLGTVRLFDLASSGSSDFRNCRALIPVNTSLKQLMDSSGAGGVGLDESGGSGSVRSQLMLPVGTATCLEAPLSSADSGLILVLLSGSLDLTQSNVVVMGDEVTDPSVFATGYFLTCAGSSECRFWLCSSIDKLPTQSELKAVIPAIAMAAGSFGAVAAGGT